MDNLRSSHYQHQPVLSKPPQQPQPGSSKYALNNTKSQPFKLRKASVQNRPVSRTASLSRTRPLSAFSSANSITVPTLTSRRQSVPNTHPSVVNEKHFRNECSALQPNKPKVLANDQRLEHKFARYLYGELMLSLVEEDETTTRDILIDEEIVSELYACMDEREVGITLSKNWILYSKLNDIEALKDLLLSLSTILNTFTPELNFAISSWTSKLSNSMDRLPISNCTFKRSPTLEIWKTLGENARKLNTMLCSEDKPFYMTSLLEVASEEVKEELESLESNTKQKLSLYQSLTYLISLKLSYQLTLEYGITNKSPCASPKAEEEIKSDRN